MAGEQTPFMAATDKNVFPVKYISFASWGRTEGLYFFDCHTVADSDTDEIVPAERELTNEERMFNDIMSQYDVSVVPQPSARNVGRKLDIITQIKILRVNFDTKTSILKTTVNLRMVKSAI